MRCRCPQNTKQLVRSPWAVKPPQAGGALKAPCQNGDLNWHILMENRYTGLGKWPATCSCGGGARGARPKPCFPRRSPGPRRSGAAAGRPVAVRAERCPARAGRSPPAFPALCALEKRAPIHMRRWQGRKGDKKRTTAENSPARLSAITTLSPACAWKEALPSAEENQLRKAKFEQRIPVVLKHPMWQDISLSFRAQSFPPIHRPFTSAAELPGGLLSSQRRWLPPRSCCSSPFSPALFHCWVSARRDCARHAGKRAGFPSSGWPEAACLCVRMCGGGKLPCR